MSLIDLNRWVDAEPDPSRKTFRQATHLLLRAIANSHRLAPLMVMKGGTLLAIRYNSPRFTKDIDFSTTNVFADSEVPIFLEDLSEALTDANADNEYGLMLKAQSHALKPKAEKHPTFPTLQVKIGYANRINAHQIKQLQAKNAANTISIDYSYNEWSTSIEHQSIDGGQLSMYAFHDLIAEKYRSVLQQAQRNRKRFQDIYDLGLLIENHSFSDVDKLEILVKLRMACERTGLTPLKTSLQDEAIIALSREDYEKVLPNLLKDQPPLFDMAYGAAKSFFEALPWE